MAPKMPQRLENILTQGGKDFFSNNGITAFNPSAEKIGENEFQWTGIIGLAGDLITGSLAITCKEDLLMKTHPNIAMGMPVGQEDLTDWLGEIANQMLGRIKNLVLEYGVSFSLSAPTVVKGQSINVQEQGKKAVTRQFFSADGHPVVLTLVAIINPNFNFDTAVKVSTGTKATEGDSLLF